MKFELKGKYIQTLTTLMFLLLCNNLTSQNLTIKIQNNTGHKIDSLIVGAKYIGTIEKDSITGPIQFAKFGFDSGIPNETIFGLIGEKRLKNVSWSWCGTSQSIEETGDFFFKLTIRGDGDEEFLHLQ